MRGAERRGNPEQKRDCHAFRARNDLFKFLNRNGPTQQPHIIVNDKGKWSLRGAERRGNLMRLLHCVRNDSAKVHLFESFTIIHTNLPIPYFGCLQDRFSFALIRPLFVFLLRSHSQYLQKPRSGPIW